MPGGGIVGWDLWKKGKTDRRVVRKGCGSSTVTLTVRRSGLTVHRYPLNTGFYLGIPQRADEHLSVMWSGRHSSPQPLPATPPTHVAHANITGC